MIDPRIVAQFNARAPFRLEDATVLCLANIGSHSHGTYVPKDDPQAIDDVDYMLIVAPPLEYVVGLQRWEGCNFQHEELDVVAYSFEKAVRLINKSNPNVLGLLWLRPEFYTHSHPVWDRVVAERARFSSLEAYPAFLGYANAQLRKMTAFDRATQEEWEQAVAFVERVGWTKEQVIADAHLPMPLGWPVPDPTRDADDYRPAYDAQIRALEVAKTSIKRIHARHFQGYMGEKRKALVRKYGYDTKNAAHLVRLMDTCLEFLATGTLNVYRYGAAGERIRSIKRGEWTLEAVQAEAARLFDAAHAIKPTSNLPAQPERAAVDALLVECHFALYPAPVMA